MKTPAFEILKLLTRARELKLGELKKHVRVVSGDHRDWYPVAALFDAGYISSDLKDGGHFRATDTKQIAITLHTMTFGPGAFEYEGQPLVNGGDFNELVTLFCTAKAELFLEELSSKRVERFFALLVGVVAAVATALATLVVNA